jgi:D-galactonate transporter
MHPTATATATGGGPIPGGHNADHVERVYSKVGWRIMPLLFICYMVAYLDRINIGYAQLQMKQTLPFGDAAYGLGAGIFFIGYLIFEVPSNLMLEKIGARKTLLRIMFCWGIVASAMMFVQTPMQFYVARFLLGAFEAGFFPGIILYLTFWYPPARRGQMIAIFLSATTVMSMFAGPLCGAILKYMNGLNGWHGWQWLFLVQGLPASILGIVCYLYLQDKPEDAQWLSTNEKQVLRDHLDHDQGLVAGAAHGSFWQALRDPKVYVLSLAYFMTIGGIYAMVFWVPTLIKSWGVNDLFMVGIYAAIPNIFGVIGMILIGRSSDRHKERRWHFVAVALVAVVGLLIMTQMQGNLVGSLVGLSIGTIGVATLTPLFFTITSEYLSKAAAAGGIALISSLGNLGSAASPVVGGAITASTGNPNNTMYMVMVMFILAGLIVLFSVRPKKGP